MLLKHSFLYVAGRIAPALIGLVAVSVYTRLLTPSDYGQYALIMSGVGLGNLVLFQWLRVSVTRLAPGFTGDRIALLTTAAAALLGCMVLSGLLLGTASIFVEPSLRMLVLPLFAALCATALFEMTLELARAGLRPGLYGLIFLVRALLAFGLGAALAFYGFGASGLVYGFIGGTLAAVAAGGPALWGALRPSQFDGALLRRMWAYGAPLTVSFAMTAVIDNLDRLMLGWLAGTAQAGQFAVSYDLSKQSLYLLLQAVNLAAFPLAIRALEKEGEDAARRQLTQNGTMIAALGIPAAAGLALLAAEISAFLLGPEFRQTATALIPWVALATLLNGLRTYYFDQSFQLAKTTRRPFHILTLAALVNIGANLILIPRFGGLGAAWALVATYALALGLSMWWGRQAFRMPLPWADLLKVLTATGLMALTIMLVKASGLSGAVTGLVASLVAAVCVYGSALLLFNVGGLRSIAFRTISKVT